ncbi:Small ubiquitin-related modifier 1 [Linum grandiflorum]
MDSGSTHVRVKVQDENGRAVCFRVIRTIELKRLMEMYCENQQKDINTVRFVYDGKRVHSTDTPLKLEFEDEDEIDVFEDQFGGGGD